MKTLEQLKQLKKDVDAARSLWDTTTDDSRNDKFDAYRRAFDAYRRAHNAYYITLAKQAIRDARKAAYTEFMNTTYEMEKGSRMAVNPWDVRAALLQRLEKEEGET